MVNGWLDCWLAWLGWERVADVAGADKAPRRVVLDGILSFSLTPVMGMGHLLGGDDWVSHPVYTVHM